MDNTKVCQVLSKFKYPENYEYVPLYHQVVNALADDANVYHLLELIILQAEYKDNLTIETFKKMDTQYVIVTQEQYDKITKEVKNV